MGQAQSARLVSQQEDISRIELVFATKTLGTAISPDEGSRPSIVSRTLHATTLTVTVQEGDFPVTGDRPEEAIRLVLRCIQALPGITAKDWTPDHFLSRVSSIELINRNTLSLVEGNVVRRGDSDMFVRIHYQEYESLLRDLLAFFSAQMTTGKSSVLQLRPRGYGDLIAQVSFNFSPTEVNITSEAQMLGLTASQSPAGSSSVGGMLDKLGVGGMLAAGNDLKVKVEGIGKVLAQGLGVLAPLLQSQSPKMPNTSGSSPSNAVDLVDMLTKYEPAIKALKLLQDYDK